MHHFQKNPLVNLYPPKKWAKTVDKYALVVMIVKIIKEQ